MPDAQSDFTKNIPEKITSNVEAAKTIGAIYLFKITGDGGGTWTLNLKDDVGVKEGDAGNAECTIEVSSEDWKQMSENPGAAMQLYFQGKLKVGGNQMLATKMTKLFQYKP